MPCYSDYLNADQREIELSKVACLLDEINYGSPIHPDHWRGYHPDVYNKPLDKALADAWVSTLCKLIRGIDVTKQSLEMQIWWRDHQKADAEREAKEKATQDLLSN